MLVVSAFKQISQDCVRITLSSGSCFFFRLSYLTQLNPERLYIEASVSEDEAVDIINASLIFAAEKVAVSYLERSEQSRYLLFQKLVKKGFDREVIPCALDYLEMRGYLCDKRYAEAWLRNRAINRSEGRIKLIAELAARGIERSTAQDAVTSFFESVSEEDMCVRAIEKCRRQGKTKAQIEKYLQRVGFSNQLIRINCQNLT